MRRYLKSTKRNTTKESATKGSTTKESAPKGSTTKGSATKGSATKESATKGSTTTGSTKKRSAIKGRTTTFIQSLWMTIHRLHYSSTSSTNTARGGFEHYTKSESQDRMHEIDSLRTLHGFQAKRSLGHPSRNLDVQNAAAFYLATALGPRESALEAAPQTLEAAPQTLEVEVEAAPQTLESAALREKWYIE